MTAVALVAKQRSPACAGDRCVRGGCRKPGSVCRCAVKRSERPPFLSRSALPPPVGHPIRSSDGAGSTSPTSGFAPGGVCRARPLAGSAVGSYPAVSPLPTALARGWRSVFCCTVPIPPRRETAGFASHPALWSPDFPRPSCDGRGDLAVRAMLRRSHGESSAEPQRQITVADAPPAFPPGRAPPSRCQRRAHREDQNFARRRQQRRRP
jgi:hypothetical protein